VWKTVQNVPSVHVLSPQVDQRLADGALDELAGERLVQLEVGGHPDVPLVHGQPVVVDGAVFFLFFAFLLFFLRIFVN
jgi:hypothetical protein